MISLFAKQICWLCQSGTPLTYSWNSLSLQQNKANLCHQCSKQLLLLTGPRCSKCSRMLDELDKDYIHGTVCHDCFRWEQQERWKNILHENISFYKYNSFLKNLMARYKYRGDYAIAELFATDIKTTLSKYPIDYIVPIPLSEERLVERGFNQSEAFIKMAKLTPTNLLVRIHSEKQSKKSRKERMDLDNLFQLKEGVDVKDKNIFLIDDIYTTGSTLRYASEILRNAGAYSVSSVTIAR
ncbi:ComF family protein [Bacillus massiliigorillae]|uniref:ComF family protein n=1 Tax=Bacillus massiliigorillae TaxID=1243664 RepID=UPI00039E99EF|nr:ComF family protein [Bacillus massiliigorillae]